MNRIATLCIAFFGLLLAMFALVGEGRAQSQDHPAALNMVNLCTFNPNDSYTAVHRVWGAK